ncbi:hypothetical protein P5705_14015 [Pseudomonas entomophila]|uniref:hypothetical protein n=1 Tax=Pseudomonas entomophila TaxID=312306 RepID=UPI002405439A|nr:hypothetical protein [Pseudomonas entomophila]MDF9618764.1 hypothetical protein [Pseudomonas entomophila]
MSNVMTLQATGGFHINHNISETAFDRIKECTSEKEAAHISIWRKIADLFCGTDTEKAYRLLYQITHATDHSSALNANNKLQSLSSDPSVFKVIHNPSSRTITIRISDTDAFTTPATYSTLGNQKEPLSPDIGKPLAQAIESPRLKEELKCICENLTIAHEANKALTSFNDSKQQFTKEELSAANAFISAQTETLEAYFAKNSANTECRLAQAILDESNYQGSLSTLQKESSSIQHAILNLEQSIQEKNRARDDLLAKIKYTNLEKSNCADPSNFDYLLTATPNGKFLSSLYGVDANASNKQFISALASTKNEVLTQLLEDYDKALTAANEESHKEAANLESMKTKNTEIQTEISDIENNLAKAKLTISSSGLDKTYVKSLIDKKHSDKIAHLTLATENKETCDKRYESARNTEATLSKNLTTTQRDAAYHLTELETYKSDAAAKNNAISTDSLQRKLDLTKDMLASIFYKHNPGISTQSLNLQEIKTKLDTTANGNEIRFDICLGHENQSGLHESAKNHNEALAYFSFTVSLSNSGEVGVVSDLYHGTVLPSDAIPPNSIKI